MLYRIAHSGLQLIHNRTISSGAVETSSDLFRDGRRARKKVGGQFGLVLTNAVASGQLCQLTVNQHQRAQSYSNKHFPIIQVDEQVFFKYSSIAAIENIFIGN